MELWLDFVYLLTHNEDYRAGFVSGLILIALIWIAWGLFFRIYVQWLKVRQFFEPIKKPGKVPTETGPSPAGMLLGCIWRVVIAILIVATLILVWLIMASTG